jgi:hypothetical protein
MNHEGLIQKQNLSVCSHKFFKFTRAAVIMFVVTTKRPFETPKMLPAQLKKELTTQRRTTQRASTPKEKQPAVPITESKEDTGGGSELSILLIMFANNDCLG